MLMKAISLDSHRGFGIGDCLKNDHPKNTNLSGLRIQKNVNVRKHRQPPSGMSLSLSTKNHEKTQTLVFIERIGPLRESPMRKPR